MLKFMVVFLMSILCLEAKTYVVVDIAQGISLEEYNEAGRVLFPNKNAQKSIYKNKEEVFLYSYNETNALSKEFVYYERDKDETAYKKGKKEFFHFFNQLKRYGVKKRKIVGSNIVFLIDTSGSMKKNGVMEDVKDTMRYFIKKKSKKSKIAIVTFDGKKHMKEEQKAHIVSGFERRKSKLLQVVDTIEPSRYDTFLGAGLQKVKKLLNEVDTKKSMVLLFTDGKAVDDAKKALQLVKRFKKKGIKLKVVAVGGADVDMLESFSTTGYVFDATSSDLQSMVEGMSVGNDAVFLELKNFFANNPTPTKEDKIIIYSTMMNVDTQSDFYVVPNIASKQFFKEIKQMNKNRDAALNLHGAKVYVRVIGKIDATQVNKLRIFYKNYFKESKAELKYFSNAPLSKQKIR